ncbi:MAG: bifunctional diaminohydroxyphosphoribosylaminopyrimidine deaminase/5-amino-6-(5-phosphoribosylamino)uracil reductase RibD, partial [Phycisphaerae bacterium]|nr:bifunctional diaminohydroxyphosphoribosylaminopyrimidine deaminase/5-amino-6-(5-phosphoribosylamino)uracil reductase RibD [Phycisphaerae bacterium]MDW8262695.1 bifunctional diaminohydroxyphosphoribosylaminopyrimidine deaminase/5-amino-6-(5-phosphoribosylamino)uracil reductase RibD [Phycisphaerales bacterium]
RGLAWRIGKHPTRPAFAFPGGSQPPMTGDEPFLRRAIRLAMNGRGRVEPNPMVGAVLVREGQIIGEGFHAEFGGPHAEPAALADCQSRGCSPTGATAYVTLEPCCHTNKKTPPCAPQLIAAGIARVVIGCLDPNPLVNGKGVALLQAAGIEVSFAPVALAAECRQLIAPFIATTRLRRPYVTAKWAQTADGHVAGPMGQRLRITCPPSDRLVHLLRGRSDAIAVGTNTVLQDDPLLTARGGGPTRPLKRVVLSNTLALPKASRLVQSAREHPVILYCAQRCALERADRVEELRRLGVEVVPLPTRDEGRFSLQDALRDLQDRGVTHLLIEPGPTLARSLLLRGQVDRVWVFQSPRRLNLAPELAISLAPQLDYPQVASMPCGEDTLSEYLNPSSEAFFAATPSADFVLAADQINR